VDFVGLCYTINSLLCVHRTTAGQDIGTVFWTLGARTCSGGQFAN